MFKLAKLKSGVKTQHPDVVRYNGTNPAVAFSRDFSLAIRQGSEEESHKEADVRILGILLVHAMGICFGLEICTLKVTFEKQIIHSVNSCHLHHKYVIYPGLKTSTCLFEGKLLFLET